jgi:hypothetical protein
MYFSWIAVCSHFHCYLIIISCSVIYFIPAISQTVLFLHCKSYVLKGFNNSEATEIKYFMDVSLTLEQHCGLTMSVLHLQHLSFLDALSVF